jgi:DNA-binding MarR family transcriptional regulator
MNKVGNRTDCSSCDMAESSIGLLFRGLKLDFTRRIIEKLKLAGYEDFTPFHLIVLGSIMREDGIRLTKIAENLAISKQAIKEIIDYLEERKYLKRIPDPVDLRAKNVTLTKLGKKLSVDSKKAAEEIRTEYIAITGEKAFRELENSIKLIINHSK